MCLVAGNTVWSYGPVALRRVPIKSCAQLFNARSMWESVCFNDVFDCFQCISNPAFSSAFCTFITFCHREHLHVACLAFLFCLCTLETSEVWRCWLDDWKSIRLINTACFKTPCIKIGRKWLTLVFLKNDHLMVLYIYSWIWILSLFYKNFLLLEKNFVVAVF